MTAENPGAVRAARRGDLQQLVDLRMRFLGETAHDEPRLRLLPDARQRTEQALPVWMGQEDRILLVAEAPSRSPDGEAGPELIGYAMGLLNVWPPVFQSQHVGEIAECYVNESSRGKGVGGALIKLLTDVLCGRGATVLRGGVPVSNASVRAHLVSAGYAPLQFVMERRLNAL